MRPEQGALLVAVILIVAAIFGALLYSGGLTASIVDDTNTRVINIDGFDVYYKASWVNTRFQSAGSSDYCERIVSDSSVDDHLQVDVNYGIVCSPAAPVIEVEIPDLDLSEYESVIIHREIDYRVNAPAKWIVVESSIDGGVKDWSNTFTVDNYITDSGLISSSVFYDREGSAIKLTSLEKEELYSANDTPVFSMTFRSGNSFDDLNLIDTSFKITGIETTPLDGGFQEPPVIEQSFFAKIGTWLEELWNTIKGWFSFG